MNFLTYALTTIFIAASPDPDLRQNISLDVYNRDQALVREIRTVALKKGENIVDFRKIAPGIFGHTIQIMPTKDIADVKTSTVSYNYDLINHEKLMQRYKGEWFSFETEDRDYYGKLLAFDEQHLFLQPDTLDDLLWVVERGKMTDLFYPGIPEGLFTSPTIRWEAHSRKKKKKLPVEISYITDAISWLCDYRAEVVSHDSIRLSGNFTIRNNLPLEFPEAEIDLVAGSTHRSEDPNWDEAAAEPGRGSEATSAERLFEYYRYPLEKPINLRGDQTIQVPFFDPIDVKVERRFIYPHLLDANQILVNLRFMNDGSAGIGFPLPEGDLGVYNRDGENRLHFVGEDIMPPSPIGAKVELNVGRSFNLTAKRTRIAQARPSRDRHQETWRIELTNGGEEAVTVHVEQRVFGYYSVQDVTVNKQPGNYETEAADKLVFPVVVAGNGSSTLLFTLVYGY